MLRATFGYNAIMELDGLRGRSSPGSRPARRRGAGHAVEDATWLDPAVEHVGQQLLDVGAHGRGAAGDRRVLPERDAGRGRVVLRARRPDRPRRRGGRSPSAVSTAWPRPTHSSTECAPSPPVSSRTRSTRRLAALAHESVAPNSLAERDPIGVAAEQDDLFGAEALRRDDAAEADGAVADDRDGLARRRPSRRRPRGGRCPSRRRG